MLFIYILTFFYEILAYFMIYKMPCKVMFSPRKISTLTAGKVQINDIKFNRNQIPYHIFHRIVWLLSITNDIKILKKFILELEKSNVIDRNFVKVITISYYNTGAHIIDLYIDENMRQTYDMENGIFSKTDKQTIFFDQILGM